MNISTPVHKKNVNDFSTDDAKIVSRSLSVSQHLDEYLDHLTSLVKSRFNEAKDPNRHQSKLHGLAWTATYVEALKQMSIWAEQLSKTGTFGKTERIIITVSF